MGRMADARKRARRGETAAGAEAPPPPPDEPVFADEPEPEPDRRAGASPAPARVSLPASGLAEDILRQVETALAAGGTPVYGLSQIIIAIMAALILIFRRQGLLGGREVRLPGFRRVR